MEKNVKKSGQTIGVLIRPTIETLVSEAGGGGSRDRGGGV